MRRVKDKKLMVLGGWYRVDEVLPESGKIVHAIYLLGMTACCGCVKYDGHCWYQCETINLIDGMKRAEKIVALEPTPMHTPYLWRYNEPNERDFEALTMFRNAR
jgi:hypothetical protein